MKKILNSGPVGWALGAAAVMAALSAGAAPVRVKIDSGSIIGAGGAGQAVFKGVPYAAAPVGALRWMPPQKPARRSSKRAAA